MQASVDINGKKEYVKMGSYGIGVSRLVGAIIEAKYDDKNELMCWPTKIAPYHCAIIPLINKNDKSSLDKAMNISKVLINNKIDTIIDDTDESLSAKMKKFNLIGIPFQIILGKKSDGKLIEFKKVGDDIQKIDLEEIIKIINKEL